ncbi:hypothetical protein [Lentilactobacillus hilgardii]|uniref:hypothetical protein n=1 Tax=Lentilactobacillus hilgardii TaxID=1588 RepID=UPI00390C98BE
MATPNVGILTNEGKNLIDQVNAGKTKITFSKIVFSSMNNNQLTDEQIKALTTVEPQEIVVNNPKVTLDNNTGETRIRATGNNEALTDGVYVKTYAVYAKDDSGNEILYGITVSPNPNYLPEYDGVTPQAVTYSYKVNISNTSNITFTNSNDIYVSDTDLAEALQPYAKTVDVNQQLDKKVVDNKDGTEQLNGIQVQPFNKLSDTIGGRNLLLGTSSVEVINSTWNNFINVDITNLVGKTLTYSAILDITDSTRGSVSFSLTPQDSSGNSIGDSVSSNSVKFGNVGKAIATITIPAGASNLSINERTNNTDFNPYVGSRKLEQGSIATDWTPAPEDKVNVSDMRKPASDVVGLDEIKGSALPNGTDLYTLINASGQPLSYYVSTYASAQTMVNKPTTKLSAFKLNTASIGDITSSNYNYTFLTLKDESDGSIYEAFLTTNSSGTVTVVKPWYKVADDSKVLHTTPTKLNSTDMNTVLTAGFYQSISGTNGIPSGDNYTIYQVIPLSSASANGVQLAYETNNTVLGMRSWNYTTSGITFSNWIQFADDSTVAHLSGANNFDTVPTVNDNPLLLASSLPSDLARTGSDQEFTGNNTFDTAPIDKTTGNPYITKDGVPSDVARTGQAQTFTAAQTFSIAPVINDASTDKGDNQAATMADLKSVEESAWRELDLSGTSGIYQGRILIKIDQANQYVYFIMNAQVPLKAYTKGTKIIDLSSVVTGLSSAHGYFQGWINDLENPYSITGSTMVASGSSIELGDDYNRIDSDGVSRIATEADPSQNYAYVTYDSLVNN